MLSRVTAVVNLLRSRASAIAEAIASSIAGILRTKKKMSPEVKEILRRLKNGETITFGSSGSSITMTIQLWHSIYYSDPDSVEIEVAYSDPADQEKWAALVEEIKDLFESDGKTTFSSTEE